MIKNKKHIFGILLIIAAASSACYIPEIMTADNTIATEVEKALDEILDATATVRAAETYTPYPTYTPQPTYTVQYYEGPFMNDYGYWGRNYNYPLANVCNDAEFIDELETIPDNSVFSPGDKFTKTWTLMNTGRCTWNTDYKLVFTSGNSLGGIVASEISSDVPPGGMITLSVDLTAPPEDGTYKGEWALQTDGGYKFARFWVQIKVR